MGISTALQAAHNDDLHTGNAKRAAASGLASLDASSKVVQEPASKGLASGIASLDASSKVIQEPASKGAASGIATLDASSRVPAAQLALAELIANKNAASGYAGLDANSRVAQGNSFLPSYSIPARNLNTTYQNGTRLRLVIVQAMYFYNGATGNSNAYVVGKTDAATPPTTVVGQVGIIAGASLPANLSFELTVVLFVQPNHYYRVDSTVSGTGGVVNGIWLEMDL